jgi:predicted ATPase/DNA-binding SARP family transcriptional activator
MGRCTVLGATRAFDEDGRELTLVSQPQRRLLAVLCLHAGRVVRPVVLEDHLGLSPGALRTSISRLRRLLGPDALMTSPTGYELRAAVDVAEYERLITGAHDAEAGPARSMLEQAHSLWQGTPYDEFASEPWAEVEVQRLRELQASAAEDLAVLLLDAGDDSGALGLLAPLIEAHPYRDRPRALRLRALAQLGRTTEALRDFHRYRDLLRDDVGAEPSAMLVGLDRAVAAGADLTALRDQGHPAWSRRRRDDRAALRPRTSLPAPISSFVGRARETPEVVALLDTHRLVTLTGAGGSGKSRLALRVATVRARSGADGPATWWVDLGVLAADGDVAEHIATEIGVVARRNPVTALEQRLQGRPALLVLDNAEHVVEATADVVADLLTRCPDTRALVTSREPLGLAGEVVWRVPALGLPVDGRVVGLADLDRYDAIHLFLTRAREARPGMAIDRHALDQVAAICTELDGLPLALELAAARLRTLPLPAVAQGISEIVRWTGGRERTPGARHATLRASIEWSFELISPLERQVLVALAVFRSPFDAEAAAAVAHAATDDLARLVDVGLVQLDDDSGRYRLLHTVRQFCLERAAAQGTADASEAAHARFFVDWCIAVGEGRLGLEHRPFVRRMPDVVAAMAWARAHDREAAFSMSRGLAPVRSVLGHLSEFATTWTWLMDLDDDLRGPLWVDAVAGSMTTATAFRFDTGPAVAAVVSGLPAGPGAARSWLERGRAMVPAYGGRLSAIVGYVEGLVAGRDDLEASVYLGFAAYMVALAGRLDESDRLLERLRRLRRRHGLVFSVDTVGNGYAAAIVAEVLRGDLAGAADRSRGPVPVAAAFSITSAAALAHAALLAGDGDAMARAVEWSTLGAFPLLAFLTPFTATCTALLDGRRVEAADLAEDFWAQATDVPVWRVFALPVVVAALLGAGRLGVANGMVSAAGALLADMEPAANLTASWHLGEAVVALAAGDVDAAAAAGTAAFELARAGGLALAAVDAAEVLAEVAERCGTHGATSWSDEAVAQRDLLGYRFSLLGDRPGVGTSVGSIRASEPAAPARSSRG